MERRDFFLKRTQAGLTLIELIVTVVVIGILATVAAPSFSGFFERQRLVGAADSLYSSLRFARAEALKADQTVTLTFDDSTAAEWCIGIKDSAGSCDCEASDCTVDGALRVVSYTDFPGVSASTIGNTYQFDSKRGTVSSTDEITFTNSSGSQLRIEMTKLGRPSLCAPSGSTVSGYSGC
jgi:prepilin-type N-terminal cleavage/methylation domain-containing protein